MTGPSVSELHDSTLLGLTLRWAEGEVAESFQVE